PDGGAPQEHAEQVTTFGAQAIYDRPGHAVADGVSEEEARGEQAIVFVGEGKDLLESRGRDGISLAAEVIDYRGQEDQTHHHPAQTRGCCFGVQLWLSHSPTTQGRRGAVWQVAASRASKSASSIRHPPTRSPR